MDWLAKGKQSMRTISQPTRVPVEVIRILEILYAFRNTCDFHMGPDLQGAKNEPTASESKLMGWNRLIGLCSSWDGSQRQQASSRQAAKIRTLGGSICRNISHCGSFN